MLQSDEFKNLWCEKYRPTQFSDLILSTEDRNYFQSLKDKQEIPHLLFTGNPGVGKTTLSKIIVNDILDCQYLYLNASDENGIDTIRTKISGFAHTKSFDGKMKVILLDEADALTNQAQDALRNVMEEYSKNCRFILTGNHLHKISKPIQSRCQSINLAPPIKEIGNRIVTILKSENIQIPDDEMPKLLKLIKGNYPDIRSVIGKLQQYSHSGILQIKDSNTKKISDVLCNKLKKKENINIIRKYIIEREVEFSANYQQLLKEMFEFYFNDEELSQDDKTDKLLQISEAMYRDSLVIDKEINWFACCIKL